MIPQTGINATNMKRLRHPTRTYRLDLSEPEEYRRTDSTENNSRSHDTGTMNHSRITLHTDGLAAMEQAVYKILRTERYQYEIYNWNYGVELDDLFGKPKPFVKAELPRRIREALLVDDRITGVDGFTFTGITAMRNGASAGSGLFTRNEAFADRRTVVSVRFTVHTAYGSFEASRDVAV